MKLSDLILHVGDEHVQLQNLEQSLVRAQAGKSDGEITFATDQSKVMQLALDPKTTKHIGLVVWLPRDRLPKSMQ